MTTLNGETGTEQNALPNTERPSTDEGSTPSGTPKTYTEEELRQRHSKLMKTIDSVTKERDALKQNLESTNSSLNELQKRIDEAENEKYKDDPDSLKTLEVQRQLKRDKDELAKLRKEFDDEKSQHADRLKRADELELELNVWKSAQAHGLDASTLKDKCSKFNLTSEEQIEEMAETLSQSANKTPPLQHVDSNKGAGGGTDYSKLSPREKIEQGLLNQAKNK